MLSSCRPHSSCSSFPPSFRGFPLLRLLVALPLLRLLVALPLLHLLVVLPLLRLLVALPLLRLLVVLPLLRLLLVSLLPFSCRGVSNPSVGRRRYCRRCRLAPPPASPPALRRCRCRLAPPPALRLRLRPAPLPASPPPALRRRLTPFSPYRLAPLALRCLLLRVISLLVSLSFLLLVVSPASHRFPFLFFLIDASCAPSFPAFFVLFPVPPPSRRFPLLSYHG
jgi:hypothetical protein